MKSYQNAGGDSGIVRYECGADFIVVEFHDGWKYEYTYESAGADRIEQMRHLAEGGQGLNAFINTNVRKRYSRKWR